MTAKKGLLVLIAALLLQPMLLKAQTDSLAFEQGRLRIWCETARFVYDDNGADSLISSINCQSWEGLNKSLRSTDANLGVMRLMNSVDKPSIYEGFTGTENKLQKLVSEIKTRLKTSPVRANDPRRLERVDSLSLQLQHIARQAGPLNEGPGAYVDDTALSDPEFEEAGDELPPAALMEPDEPLQTNMPWNEILQWLALLLLGGFLFWRLRDVEQRYRSLKKEFRTLEQQVNGFIISNIQSAPRPLSGASLSEEEVRDVVKEELQQNKPSVKPVAASTADVAVAEQNLPKPSATLPPPPIETPQSVSEQKQPVAPVAASSEKAGLFYDKMPFRGGFHQNEMSRERQRDSLYTIRVLQGRQEEADYWVTEDPDIQRYAMQNGLSFFEEGCEFTEVDENPGRVVNEQKGKLRKEGGVWKILQKAKVRFE